MLTIVFTDVVDSTGTKIRAGDAIYLEALEAHNERIRKIVGHAERNTAGDSFFLSFEDAAEAVSTAVHIQRSFIKHAITVKGEPLAVRIGMHAGNPLPVVHPGARVDYSGTAVDQASRVAGLADGEQVFISDTVHFLVKERRHDLPPEVHFHDWGPYCLKGAEDLKDTEDRQVFRTVFEVLWDGRPPGKQPAGRPRRELRRFAGRFVGRDKELRDIM